jgi:hypothetical protein
MNYTVLSWNPRPEFLPNHQTTDNDEEKFPVKYWSGCTLKCGRTKYYRWRQWAFSQQDPGELTKLILAEGGREVQEEGKNNNTD